MTPKELEPYAKAYKLERNLIDNGHWEQGLYNHMAVLSSIDKAFNGKKSTLNYFDKPFSEKYKAVDNKDEKLKKAKLLFANLEVMQSNFNLNKGKKAANK